MPPHGAQELFGWFDGDGRERTGRFLKSIGLRPGPPLAVLAGGAELVGGLLLALGLFVPATAALLTAVMLVAIWTVHRANGAWNAQGGWEYDDVVIAVVFAVAAIGAGDLSLDAALGTAAAGVDWAVGQLLAGLMGAAFGVALARRSFERPSGARPAAVGGS